MNRTQFRLSLIAACAGMALAAQASAQDANARKAHREMSLSRLASETGGLPEVTARGANGHARFLRDGHGGKLRAARAALANNDAGRIASSTQFLNQYGSLFGVTDAARELGAPRVRKDRQGGSHVTHRQFYKGVPVLGGELKSHFDAANNLVVVNGHFVADIDLDVTPRRSAEDAAKAAMTRVIADLSSTPKMALFASKPTLTVYREGLMQGVDGPSRLAWQVEVGNRDDVRDFVYVDAHTGKVIEKISGIHEGKFRRAFDGANSLIVGGPNYPANPFWIEGQAFPTGNIEADNMIQASSEVYDLFKTAFGRDSYDGNGAVMDSIFNRGYSCPNASWNGVFISFCPGTTTDDVTAHEWGHAYTEYTHGLIYAWQPGALNEAYSDIWGETIDRLNGRMTDLPDGARSANACSVATSLQPTVTINSPAAIAGVLPGGGAAFGPQSFSVSGNVAGVGVGTANAGCGLPFAEDVAGKIAFIDRGTCGFAVKTKNAQLSGAVGVIVGNNQGGTAVINMAGVDPSITIPAVSVPQNSGTAIKAQLAAGVNATLARGGLGTDLSVRWLIGEDSAAFGGAIRDMYTPTCYGNPGKVSDIQYHCGPNTAAGDNGGVHINSGVPNHGFALLVDGGSYNGRTVLPIGLTKAAHLYWRAQSVYQGPASGFADHADALEQSCRDLTGVNLTDLKTGLPSGEVINVADCAQVVSMAAAVELRTPPAQCNFQPMLAKTPPPLCASGSVASIAADSFEGGRRASLRWQVSYAGLSPEFTPRVWGVVNKLPGGRAGSAMYAADYAGGTCAPGGDESGLQRLESPEITIPATATTLRMTFDHWMGSEAGWDGGNLKISVNGGAWTVVNAADFIYNPYNATMFSAAAGNSSPLAGEPGFTGADNGSVAGSWGRSIINLAPYARPSDKIKLRFELGQDGCGGTFGWYVDDVQIYQCKP
jgi:Zn-dependent metalloprotease